MKKNAKKSKIMKEFRKFPIYKETPEERKRTAQLLKKLYGDVGYRLHAATDNEDCDLCENAIKFARLGFAKGYKKISVSTDHRYVEKNKRFGVKISVELSDYTKSGFPEDKAWMDEKDLITNFFNGKVKGGKPHKKHSMSIVNWKTEKEDG